MAETPSSYKRFAQSDKISQGTTNAALSLNDYLPGQHVTGPNNNDIAATLAQVQAIPIGTATLSGNTYNVTISNYPNTATIYPGQKISVKFNADAPTADDTALNLSAFGQSLPLCARGVRMGQGAIKSGMILELVYRGDMWNADYDVVKANRNDNGYTTFADGQSVYNKQSVDRALDNYESLVKTNDRYSFSGSITYGYITNASQHLFLFIPTQKDFYGKSLNFETLRLVIRQNGYYIFPKENTTTPGNELDLLNTEEYQLEIIQSMSMQNGIRLQCIAPSWYRQSSSTKATNNETFTAFLTNCNFTVN